MTSSDINAKSIRAYFEAGCLCLINGDIARKGKDIGDYEAATYYLNECKCSRGFRHLEKENH